MATTTRDLLAVRDDMLRVLQDAAKHRKLREAIDDRGDPAWVGYEREAMHAEVSRIRADRGLPPVGIEHVARVEQLACGHIDYATKYALYCAELAVGVTPRELT